MVVGMLGLQSSQLIINDEGCARSRQERRAESGRECGRAQCRDGRIPPQAAKKLDDDMDANMAKKEWGDAAGKGDDAKLAVAEAAVDDAERVAEW